jgi:hypothetical protein
VFVDAVGTGYSEAITPNINASFWSVDTDDRSFGTSSSVTLPPMDAPHHRNSFSANPMERRAAPFWQAISSPPGSRSMA